MLRYEATTTASPQVAWALLSQPRRWADWAPHVRGAWGLGDPEVVEGQTGAARLLGVVPVPARITEVRPGRSWTWVVGGIRMVHAVDAGPGTGATVAVELHAAPPVELVLRGSYGPVVALLVRRLARVAARAGR